MNADRAAGSRPGGLPLPPASTTRNVSFRGTPTTAQLPPFLGRAPAVNGHPVAPATAATQEPAEPVGIAAIPESVEPVAAATVQAPAERVAAAPVQEPAEPAAESLAEGTVEGTTQPEPLLNVADTDAFETEGSPDLTAWFSNGLSDVSLAAEGAEFNTADAEPVFGADSSVPAEVVFGTGKPAEATAAESEGDDAWTAESEGIVEPAFEEDVHATEEMLAERARGGEEFPLDAFIIPEDARRLPTGVGAEDEVTAENGDGAAAEIAARFEQISRLLREEDVNALLVRLARGDRLDALLAGFLAGYLSTHDA